MLRGPSKMTDLPSVPGALGTVEALGTLMRMQPANRATLKTIASAMGLSVATVSRALKDASDIGEQTKVRVRAMAAQLGYRPNRAGVRLRTGKTNVIALVLSTETNVMNNTARLMYSIASSLRGTPYHMVVMPFFSDQDPMEPIRYLVETGGADGIIFNQTEPQDARIAYLTENHIPFATHGRTDMGIEHPYFDYDSMEFGHLAVQILAGRNCKHVYLIAPPIHQMYSHHTIAGVQNECAARGIRFELAQGIHSDSYARDVEDVVAARFGESQRPDCIISASTTAAMAAITGTEGRGLKIGQDFEIVSKEAIRFLHQFRKNIIVAHEDVSQAGEFLAQALVAAIEGRAPGAGQKLQVPKLADFHTG